MRGEVVDKSAYLVKREAFLASHDVHRLRTTNRAVPPRTCFAFATPTAAWGAGGGLFRKLVA